MSTGAGNDIERATEMARKMVCEWGMSDLGPLTFGKKEEQIFLGREIAQHRDYSEDTAIKIDDEVRKLVNHGYETAKKISRRIAIRCRRLRRRLMEREVLDATEIKLLVDGKELPPMKPPPKAGRRRAAGDQARPCSRQKRRTAGDSVRVSLQLRVSSLLVGRGESTMSVCTVC